MLLVAAGQVAGHVDERDDRDPERIAKADESRRLDGRVDVDRTGEHLGLVADYADSVAAKPPEADDYVRCKERLDLEELAIVQNPPHELAHVIGLVGRLWHDRLKLRIRALGVVGGGYVRGPLTVARRQVRKKAANARRTLFFRLGQEVRDPGRH